MFNGIIFNQGKVKKISKRKKGISIFVYCKLKISKKDIGMSISCDGVCLTLINISNKLMEFYKLNNNLERMLNIINGESQISLRIVDWFATNYLLYLLLKELYALYHAL